MSMEDQLKHGERAERELQVMLALERSLRLENAKLRAALDRLVRKGTDGRWYTSQHGDTDVTTLVSGAVT